MQCHVLGVTMLPIVGALLVADARSRPSGAERRRVWRFGLAGLAIIALSFLPLVIHELTSDFSEIHAALDYIRAGGDPTALGPPLRFVVVGVRVVSWPLAGLITDAAGVALMATGVVIAIAVALARFGSVPERQAARWLGLGLLWTVFALTFISPSLASVVPGLPNDHYHAFADPMVFTLIGLGAAALWRGTTSGTEARVSIGAVLAVVAVTALVGWNLTRQPPSTNPDGGFPAAELAAARIMRIGGSELTLRSLPDFKTTEAYEYPLIRAGARVTVDTATGPVTTAQGSLVVVCDATFEVAIGAPCGGPAEAVIAPAARFGAPVDRFLAAPGRTISIYRPAP